MFIKRLLQNAKKAKLSPVHNRSKEYDSSLNAKKSESIQDSYGKRDNLSMLLQQIPDR